MEIACTLGVSPKWKLWETQFLLAVQRPLRDIIDELSDFINENGVQMPESLVGKKILHKFEVDGQEEWFSGCVLGYDAQTHLHKVSYDQEEEQYFFNLLEDISVGDLTIIN